MKIKNSPRILSSENSLLNEFMRDLRDKEIQKDRFRFRKNVQRVGEILAYEISKELRFHRQSVFSSLGEKKMDLLKDQPVICSVLRAGLPFQNGFLDFFDRADAAFISAYRDHISDTEFRIVVQYMATPDLTGRTLILADPMLATGKSLVATYNALMRNGTPKMTIVAGLIASREGLSHVCDELPHAHVYVADCDDDLNEHAYIVPGLGDAGDLSFGEKL